MPAPTNQTAATATAISLNYTATLADVDLATPAPNCDVWYSYTAQAGDTAVGFFAGEFSAASYNPVTEVFTGTPGSLTPYPSVISIYAVNVPLQIAVVPGTTYYFRVRNDSGVSPAAGTSLSVSALRGPAFTAPTGSILINDDTPGYPAVVLSTTDGSVLQFQASIPAGEEGDSLSDGTMLIYDLANTNMSLFTITAGVLSAPTTVALDVEAIRANLTTNAFWVATQTNPATLRKVSAAGAIGGTVYTLPHNSVFGLATNAGETIAYYSQRTAGSAIHSYNLGTSSAGPDLAAGVGAAFVRDIIILDDGTLVASYVITGTGETNVLHYDAAGVLLDTYGPYTSTIPSGTQPRLAYADATSFWLWIHGTGGSAGLSIFYRIEVATGTILQTVTATEYEGGVYNRTATATPSARFGNSFSCPMIVLRAEITGTGTPNPPGGGSGSDGFPGVSPYRRRLRTFPHLSAEQAWAFHKSLQIDMETGVGVSDPTAQGYDPVVLLRWSDDGGHTWSNNHEKSMGLQGQYRHRIIYRQLGRSRDRIYELSMSDPVRSNVIAGYLDAEAGIA